MYVCMRVCVRACMSVCVYVCVCVRASTIILTGTRGLANGTDEYRQACDSQCVLCHNDAQPLNFIQTPNGTCTVDT